MQSSYSLELVLLSYAVAVLASHVTLSLAQRLRPLEGRRDAHGSRWPWIVGGAFSMGTGIWSMHFIGMLAFHLPIPVAYDLGLTAASYVIAVVVSGFALQIFRRNDTTLRGIALPGVLIGSGIAAMHYTGMAAMKMFPSIDYDPLLFATSVAIAIGAAMAALWIAFSLPQGRQRRSWHKLAAASVMGAAIVGMHYTGMAAANFAPNAMCMASGPRLDANWLAITISAFSILILGSTLLLSVIDAQLQSTIARSAEALRLANEELEQRVVQRTQQLEIANRELLEEARERQRSEQAVRSSERLLQAIIDNSTTVVYVKDLEGRYLLVNRRFEELFHRSREWIVGKTDYDVFPKDSADAFRAVDKRVLASATAVQMEEVAPHEDGLHTYVSSKCPLFDSEGRVYALCGISTDITERQRSERKQQQQLRQLNLLNRITHAIGERQDLPSILQVVINSLEDNLPIDFGCAFSYDHSTATLTVTGIGAKSHTLATELSLTPEARIPIGQGGLSRCVQGQVVYESDLREAPFAFSRRLAEGGLRSWVAVSLLVEGAVFGVLLAARRQANGFDSTDCEFLRQLGDHVGLAAHQANLYSDLQKAYEDLRQSQQTLLQQERLRALGQMASGVAHDINNAIFPASLYVESLLEWEPNLSERVRGHLGIIQRAIDDVAQTVGRMREFCRPRDPQVNWAPVNLNRIVEQVIELTRVRWNNAPQEKGIVISLVTQLAADVPLFMGADAEIRDALTNLVFNAVDAMPEGGTLTLRTGVSARPRGHEGNATQAVSLEVSDTGMGMDEATQRHCLEPFFTTKGERGTGMGLAMVYGTAQRNKAELSIDSALGQGTTVRLIFPVAPSAAMIANSHSEPKRPLRSLRILLVDDDPRIIESLRDFLRRDGHEVTATDGGQAGIDAFIAAQNRSEGFHVVFTDLGMPYVDGRRVAMAIKVAAPATPVILLTGWGQQLIADGEVPAHVDRVLNKPPKLEQLRGALEELVTV